MQLDFSNENYTAPLAKEVIKEFNRLMSLVCAYSLELRRENNINFTGGKVSIVDLIAYQIGWGTLLVGWYEAGLKGEVPQMPGEGFFKWDYVGLAKHFYKKYRFDGGKKQEKEFHKIVQKIIGIIEHEHQSKNLDKEGVWDWTILSSGKKWPLNKWIRVNTIAPYKRAIRLIKKLYNDFGK